MAYRLTVLLPFLLCLLVYADDIGSAPKDDHKFLPASVGLTPAIETITDRHDDLPGVSHRYQVLDSPVQDIIWLPNGKTVFILTEGGAVYRSVDEGQHFVRESKLTNILKIILSQANENYLFFLGSPVNFITKNGGSTYERVVGEGFHEIVLHPTNPSLILAAAMSKACDERVAPGPPPPRPAKGLHDSHIDANHCYKELYVSKNSGNSWTKIFDYVVQFQWAPARSDVEDTVFACVHRHRYDHDQHFGLWDPNIDFVRTRNYFESTEILVKYGNRFLFTTNFLLVAAVNPHATTTVSLFINNNNGTKSHFSIAKLPITLRQHSYTLLDSSEGSIFLHVNHNSLEDSKWGNVYISDATGTGFSLSLPHNRRNNNGKCDFEKIEGLEGIYMANFIDEEDDYVISWDDSFDDDQQNKRTEKVKRPKTIITYDKGGVWNYLIPPEVDFEGNPYSCDSRTDKKCYLHLHGITDDYGPFYSSYNAVGLILATGVVGHSLYDSPDLVSTFMSLTWYEVARSSHIYEFGDHGALTVMAEDEVATDHITFSWNQGLSWKTQKIASKPFHVENIVIEPSATTDVFLVYGWNEDSGIVVWVNFDNLHERPCVGHDAPNTRESDYETWTPNDGRIGGSCLMGHSVTYTRRKRDKECFNPDDFETFVIYEHCQCTEADFECDVGFEHDKSVGSRTCIPVKTSESSIIDATSPPVYCDKVYKATQGYRKIAGDTCIGGSEYAPRIVPCPHRLLPATTTGKGIVFLLLILIIGLCLFQLNNKYRIFGDIYKTVKGAFPNVEYSSLYNQSATESLDDEEESEFNIDNEFKDNPPLAKTEVSADSRIDIDSFKAPKKRKS